MSTHSDTSFEYGFDAGLFEVSGCYDEINEKNRQLGWNVQYRQLKPLEYKGVMAGMDIDEAAVVLENVDVPSEVVGEFNGGVVWIMFAFSGCGGGVYAQGTEFCGTSAFLINTGGEVDVITSQDTRLGHLSIKADEFNRAWEALAPGIDPFPCSHFGFIDIPPGSANACYQDIARILAGDYSMELAKPEYVSSVVAFLAEQAAARSRSHYRRPLAAARVRMHTRAMEFIEAHHGQNIKLSDLCAYVGGSISTLSRIFREYYGMSPAAYIRWRRMHDCHHLLQQAVPGEQSVGQIIQACGIKHPGRFASEYRRYFGATPKQTLGYI